MKLEICTETLAGALAAEQGGAARIELCSRLDLDGLTPDLDLLREVRGAVGIPVFAMARPRPGSFVMTSEGFQELLEHLYQVLDRGCDGVVLGMLREDGSMHQAVLRQARDVACDLPLTFHRAFDQVQDQAKGLEDLIACGVDRVLTSGGAATALEGAESLRARIQQAGDRCRVLIAGSVRANNLAALTTIPGAEEFHSGLDRCPTAQRVAELVALLD